jgi:DNA-binding XRE family transcriptional regulator
MHHTGDQRDHREDNRHGGDGLGPAKPSALKPTGRVTLRQLRERAGVRLGDLAAQAGVSIATLSKFETGIPDLAPATYAHAVAALETLKGRSPG